SRIFRSGFCYASGILKPVAAMKRILPVLLALCVFASVNAHATGTQPLRGLDAYVRTVMAQWKVPGLAVAIVKDGKVVLARGYGVRELGKPAKVDANTLFGIASNTKAFTAAALGTLSLSGKIRLNAPVIDYLPQFRLKNAYITTHLTVRDALSHRSGYCDPTMMWIVNDFTSARIIHQLRYQKQNYGLRAHFCYNNTMYLVAGEIVPAVTGSSWNDFVRAHFFKPLGMDNTTSHMSVYEHDHDTAVPHGQIDGKVVPITRMDTDAMAPVGGIKSSVADMSHWLIMLLADGRYHGHPVLDPAVLKTMETPQTIIPADGEIGVWAHAQTPNNQFLDYGLGFFLQSYAGHKFVWHAGDIDGMASALGMIPSEHLGIVVLSNMNQNRAPEAVMMHVLGAYLGQPPRDVSGALLAMKKKEEAPGKKFDAKLAAAHDPSAKPSLPLKKYAGTYHNNFYGKVEVSYTKGRLELAFGNPDFSATLIPWNHDTFKAPWHDRLFGDGYVTFDLDALGNVQNLKLAGLAQRFTRVPKKSPAKH
ncbi:MAG: serine hydrolase, partial [Gammaproteobacteria bacterium]